MDLPPPLVTLEAQTLVVYYRYMTLLVTLMGKNKIVQVADTRLTIEGREHESNAIKAVSVACADANFSIAYTGLAEINGARTDKWLVGKVESVFEAGNYTVDYIVQHLVSGLNSTFPALRHRGRRLPTEHKGLCLMLSGYSHGAGGPFSEPFTVQISNMSSEGVGKRHKVNLEFSACVMKFEADTKADVYQCMIEGANHGFLSDDAAGHRLNAHVNRVNRQLKRIDQGHKPAGKATAERLVSIVKEASKHPTYGHLIGATCLSTVIHPGTTAMLTNYHDAAGETVQRLPHLVTPIETISDIEIRISAADEGDTGTS